MSLNLGQLFSSLVCAFIFCTHEYPSDPLASKIVSFGWSRPVRGREDYINEVKYGYDFWNGSSNPIVSTKLGKLEGFVMWSIKGRSIYAFEGVPYGETTGGLNRFKPPVPKSAWSGVLPAKKPGEYCLQFNTLHLLQVIGSEDCLFLNIYVPSQPIQDGNSSLPVVVWFHGGYLSTGDENITGNFGLKDQLCALQFINANIANFGGNPSLVTLVGHSSGGASVHLHMLSNISRKYFSGAISISGNVYCPWAIIAPQNRDIRNKKLARTTTCSFNSSREYVNCLRKISGRLLVLKLPSIYDSFPSEPPAPLGAVIEGNWPGAFLTEHPDKTYSANKVARIPWICSRTTHETQILYSGRGTQFNSFQLAHLVVQDRIESLRSRKGSARRAIRRLRSWRRMAPSLLDYNFNENPGSITDKITEFYLESDGISLLSNYTAISEPLTDRMWGYGVHKSLQIHSQVAPTYSYLYGYQGRNSIGRSLGFNPLEIGVSHTDDVGIFFNMSSVYRGYKTTDPEYALVRLMTSALYNFALKRVPLFPNGAASDIYVWKPVTDPRNIQVLHVQNGPRLEMISEPSRERLKFWESLGLSDIIPFIPID